MIEQDCRHCENWRRCIGKDGYLFAHLIFCPFQIVWILQNESYLEKGKWPPQYTIDEEPRKHQVSKEGYFVKPVLIIAEVRERLASTGIAGRLLVAQSKLAGGLSREDIDDVAWEALVYATGWSRRDMSFNAWKYQQRYRQKTKKIYSKSGG